VVFYHRTRLSARTSSVFSERREVISDTPENGVPKPDRAILGFRSYTIDYTAHLPMEHRMHAVTPMLKDLRYSYRTLRQNPGFALTAIVSIGLGIGANATIFSLADGLLFRPLPVRDASRVVTLKSRTPSGCSSAWSRCYCW
jgi:hypothetical protein